MNKETQTKCTQKIQGIPCKGTICRDHRISKLEDYHNHRKYTCNKCGTSWKFIDKPNQ